MSINISFPFNTEIVPLFKETFGEVTLRYPCGTNTTCVPYKVSLDPGVYKFELWGAQGGDARLSGNIPTLLVKSGGAGAYTSGIIDLKTRKIFYFYIGGKGEDQWSISPNVTSLGGFNGGGDGGVDMHDLDHPESSGGGGGASDIRLDLNDMKSRIMVAAGGGGSDSWLENSTKNKYNGGEGGSLKGFSYTKYVTPGDQTSGYSFGKGANGLSYKYAPGGSIGGGGGGYYGGNLSPDVDGINFVESGGAGGSSFVSGFIGCDAVSDSSSNIVHTHQPIHYSKISFRKPEIKSGRDFVPSPFGYGFERGNFGDGFARISFLKSTVLSICSKYHGRLYSNNMKINMLTFIVLLNT